MTSDISIHDNLLLGYSVDCLEKGITLSTVYKEGDSPEYTDVVFSDVVAYHFEGDNFGTILFGITEVTPGEVYAVYKELFMRRKNYDWPSLAYDTEEELLEKLQDRSVRGFFVDASLGLDGFVLCAEMRLERVP